MNSLEKRISELEIVVSNIILNNDKTKEYLLSEIQSSRSVEEIHYERLNSCDDNFSGVYKPNNTYTEGMYCMDGGNLYRFTKERGVGIEPSNENYWEQCDVATELNRLLNMIKGE